MAPSLLKLYPPLCRSGQSAEVEVAHSAHCLSILTISDTYTVVLSAASPNCQMKPQRQRQSSPQPPSSVRGAGSPARAWPLGPPLRREIARQVRSSCENPLGAEQTLGVLGMVFSAARRTASRHHTTSDSRNSHKEGTGFSHSGRTERNQTWLQQTVRLHLYPRNGLPYNIMQYDTHS